MSDRLPRINPAPNKPRNKITSIETIAVDKKDLLRLQEDYNQFLENPVYRCDIYASVKRLVEKYLK